MIPPFSLYLRYNFLGGKSDTTYIYARELLDFGPTANPCDHRFVDNILAIRMGQIRKRIHKSGDSILLCWLRGRQFQGFRHVPNFHFSCHQ